MENEELERSEKEMGLLSEFAKKKSNFLKLTDGEEITLTIQDYAQTTDMNGNDVIAYKVILEDTSVKTLQSGSGKLAREIAKLSNEGKGVKISLKRTGEGFNTTYEVTEFTELGKEKVPF